jgi:beta-1,4-mannosyl-glycoprotein beta-1,4-N-acetylglucosaminyltransferase
MKIFDCFLFFNELDLLEIRLNVLKDKVDKFVIVEQNTTHQGEPKESVYLKNKERFSWIQDKIIHFIVDGSVYSKEDISKEKAYQNEITHRNGIRNIVSYCGDDDIILMSDLDEIPNLNNKPTVGSVYIHQLYQYNFNNVCLHPFDLKNWKGTVVLNKKCLLDNNPHHWRDMRPSLNIIIGGWHFTYFGGKDKILQKLNSFCHTDVNNERTLNNLESNLKNNKDILDWYRGGTLFTIVSDEEAKLPEYVLKNKNKYRDFFNGTST